MNAPEVIDQHRDTILFLNGVSVSFDGFKALNQLAFYVLTGELRAIIGPNGAGKTTMMDVVTGKTKPDTGIVEYFNQNTRVHLCLVPRPIWQGRNLTPHEYDGP